MKTIRLYQLREALSPFISMAELQPQTKSGDVFIHPHDVCIDEEDNTYVAQWNVNNTYPVKLEIVK